MDKISVIIPVFNEEEVIEECYKRVVGVVKKYKYELCFVNDGSKDSTLEKLRKIASSDSGVKVVSFSRNFGHQAALSAGLKVVTGDAIIILDADMQDPPELIPKMIDLWKAGNDVVYGKRKTRQGETVFKLMTASMFYKVLNKLSDVDVPKDTGDFRLVDRKIVDTINLMPEHNKFYRGLWSWCGYKQTAIEYERQERFAGKTKYPLSKMLKLAKDGIIGFSKKPLQVMGVIGLFSIFISFVVLVYSIISFIFKLNHLAAGWTSIMVAITFFAGVQLLALWIISEYIGRIYDESNRRPEYIIEEIINK